MLTHAHLQQNRLRLTLAALLVALGAAFGSTAVAQAGSPAASNCTTTNGEPGVYVSISVGTGGDEVNCIPVSGNTLQTNPIFIYVVRVLQVVAGLAGLATVGGLLWGGLLYVTARANAGQVEKAKLVMVNSVIGLLLFIFMYAILEFLVPGGFFS